MCGIAAIFAYNTDAPIVEEGELISIRDAMTSRGPDGAGLWFDPWRRMGLGHRRLSIIDVSNAGNQPMLLSKQKLAITFNGEIYNYRELRADLETKGHRFRSMSDTEVLLHLYSEEGEAMLQKLRGMYAFAICDWEKQALFLARDPFGIKPLYWADDGKTFRSASQVKALLAGGKIDTSPEPAGHVGFFLWGHVPEPYTLFRGIRALPAGHCLTVERGGKKRLRAFCSILEIMEKAEHQTSESSAPISDLLTASLRDSIRHHLIADVPVGVFLSSGLDSATIAGLASEHRGELRTVTLGFSEFRGTPNDETTLAEQIARHYGTRHQTIWVTRKDFQAELDRTFQAMDQPSSDGVNSYFISKAAAEAGLKVALSGLGGDELFGGYPSFREIPRLVNALCFLQNRRALGRGFRAISAPFLKWMTSPKYAGLLEYGGTYGGAYLLRRGMFMPWELPEILDGDLVREGWNELQTLARLDSTTNHLCSSRLKVSALEMTWYMRNQLLRDTDWASMAHSVEVRVPLVDLHLLQVIAPFSAHATAPTKRDMARTVSIPLPKPVLDRPKTGFTVPIREWLLEGVQHEEGGEPRKGFFVERGLRGWTKLVHSRFHSGVSVKARRISRGVSQPSQVPIRTGAVLARGNGKTGVNVLRPSPMPPSRSSPQGRPRRILVFRIGQLGDTIVSLPAMRAIRSHYPDAHLTLLCDRHPQKSFVLGSDLLSGAGLFNEFLSYPVWEDMTTSRWSSLAPLAAIIRKGKYDTVAYLAPSGRSPQQIKRDRWFFQIAGIRSFLGMTNFVKIPDKVQGKALAHLPTEASLLLNRLQADGIPVPLPADVQVDLGLGLSDKVEVAEWLGRLCSDDGRLWIGVAPGSKMPAKRWPEERFRDTVAGLVEGFSVWPVVFGGREDAAAGQRLIAYWGCGYNAAGELSLRGAAAALQHCAMLLTNDTGTMHLAAAVGVPCVAIFSSRAAPGSWYPLGHGHHVFRSEIECEGCGLAECRDRQNECLQRVTVDQVRAACRTLLEESVKIHAE